MDFDKTEGKRSLLSDAALQPDPLGETKIQSSGLHIQLVTLGRSLKAIGWAIVGVRKGADREKDFASLPIAHVLIASVLAFVTFILVLMGVVHWVLS